MSTEVAEAIRQTRRTLAEKTWVPHVPRISRGEVCVAFAAPDKVWDALRAVTGIWHLVRWNDRQTDVGSVLGMTLEALIAELCKGDK